MCNFIPLLLLNTKEQLIYENQELPVFAFALAINYIILGIIYIIHTNTRMGLFLDFLHAKYVLLYKKQPSI